LLTQTKYITNMLKHFDIKDYTSKSTFINNKIQLDILNNNTSKNLAGDLLFKINKECYQ